MRIAKEEIIHVGELARLYLDDAAVDLYTKQLGDVLTYMETLNHLDTAGITPASHAISINNVFRDDIVMESVSAKSALTNAPESSDGGFIVPKVIKSKENF